MIFLSSIDALEVVGGECDCDLDLKINFKGFESNYFNTDIYETHLAFLLLVHDGQ